MVKIVLEITSCDKCPHLQTERYYTGDSFENVFKWICGKTKKLITYHETFDKIPDIPDWCPLRE